MTRPSARLLALFVAAFALLAACGDDDSSAAVPTGGPDRVIVVDDATVVLPAGANSAAYLSLLNEGPDFDRLVAIRTSVAADTELHETRADDDGLMRMHHVEAIDLPVGTTVELVPGGLHAMLLEVDRLDEDQQVELELVFEHGEPVTVTAVVRSSAALVG